jgi:hypothetical protein
MSSKKTMRQVAKRLQVESLEGRALLSGGATASAGEIQEVVAIFEHALHRDPNPSELRHGTGLLAHDVQPIRIAASLLASPGYHAAHRSPTRYVDGLYHDVLGSDVDPSGERFWVGRLESGNIGRLGVAKAFLSAPTSFLNTQQSGFISNVSATNGWSSGVVGSTTAFVAGVLNRGTPPTVVSINVTAGGQYILNQSNGSFIGNNSGRTWSGFTLQILSSSTAGASFVSSSDVSGHFRTVNRSASTISFSGGTVTSGSNVIVNGFQPYTTINTARGGTIVIQETPVNA